MEGTIRSFHPSSHGSDLPGPFVCHAILVQDYHWAIRARRPSLRRRLTSAFEVCSVYRIPGTLWELKKSQRFVGVSGPA
jgi:hypothetical protein